MSLLNPFITPVLAAGGFEVITIIIIVVSLIGWLVNLINEQSRNQPRRVNPQANPRRPDNRFEDEIDQFLEEVGGQKRRMQPEQPIEIEVVPEREIWERERDELRNRKLSSIEERHVATSTLGAGLRGQVDNEMRNTIGHLQSRLDSVADTTDDPIVETLEVEVEPAKRGVQAKEIVAMLRDIDGVRKAVIVNEVLRRRPLRR